MVARWIKVFPKVERSRIPSMEGGQWRQIEREHPDPGNNDKGLGRDSAGETTWDQGLAVFRCSGKANRIRSDDGSVVRLISITV